MKKKVPPVQNDSTEQKIKEAARRVFMHKGYAATRTRDIAEESGYNLALINYYFRSKENLYQLVMLENVQLFVSSVLGVMNDEETTLHEKVEVLVGHYIDMLIANPGMPLFLLSEMQQDPQGMLDKVGVDIKIADTYLAKQWMQLGQKKKNAVNPVHILLNVVSMTVFPFIASPMLQARSRMSQETFDALMVERKKLIPMWMKQWIG
jgi:AcrR family transcriptional regulator